MGKLTQKWCVVSLLEPVDEGVVFHWKDWPLHITLAPTFATTLEGKDIRDLLGFILEAQDALEIKTLEELQWSTKVTRLERTDEIHALHIRIISALKDKGAVFNEPQYIGDNFIPHATIQKDKSIQTGETVRLESISLVDMFPNADGHNRRIVKTFKLR